MKKLFTLSMAVLLALCSMQAQRPTKHMIQAFLPIDHLDGVKLYTNEAYSKPGAYDYAFAFSCAEAENEYGFPWVQFELILPTAEGLTAGTYTLGEGNLDYIVIIRGADDYYYYYYGYDPYEFKAAKVTLTSNGENNWTIDFSATSSVDTEYTFSYTGDINVEIDDSAPSEGGGGGDPAEQYTYQYEPTTPTTMNIAFNQMDRYDGYIAEHGVLDLILDTPQADANGHNYSCRLYLFTDTPNVPAGTYPIDGTHDLLTWQQSPGCSTTSNSLDYPCYVSTYDNNHVYDSWYMVSGTIAVSYDADGHMLLEGHAKTYNGSTINFTYSPEGQDGIGTVIADEQATAAPAQKILRHGDIMLQQGQHRFNLQGIRL